jgi:predicted amidohydrolase
VGPFICYDLRFPEIAREAVQLGAEVLVCIASWPVARVEHWLTLLRARAIENQAYVVGVNRVGAGGSLIYSGDSRIFGPLGETLAAGSSTEEILFADVSPEHVATTRLNFPFMKDR